jgi:hypothetical protein
MVGQPKNRTWNLRFKRSFHPVQSALTDEDLASAKQRMIDEALRVAHDATTVAHASAHTGPLLRY